MCWICATDRSQLVESFWGSMFSAHYQRASETGGPATQLDPQLTFLASKGYDAFPADGVGDFKPMSTQTVLILTPDDVADNTGTSATLTVGAPAIVSTINTIGDQDFFRIDLVAGHMYDIGQYAALAGPSGVPLPDAYIEIYTPDGELLTNADGGGPNTPQGLDALLTFVAQETGTYYINARAFDQDGTNGTTGDAVGDYELFANDVTGRPDTTYTPYYDVSSPLHSIDWGTQVDGTSRNPDGEEGPRVTGNPFTGTAWNPYGIEGKNVITVYFAKAGDVFLSEDPLNPGLTTTMVAKGLQDWEKQAFDLALDQYEKVADVVFVEVDNRAEADFKVITYIGTPGAGASLLGRMSAPDELNEGQAEFNAGDVRWTEEGLQQGGFYFPTLLHEFGHGMGMAHPHDNGGHSSIMRGAGGGTGGIGGGIGDFDLSQQVFTVMSYNDGWQTSPYGQPRSGGLTGTQVDHFGWVGTLSPLDIAVIQDKYGVNEDWAAGDDTYVIQDVNGPGNFYQSIWDAGGNDQIVYSGAQDATIDLRPATLVYEEGGGGRVSYAYGIHGGYTIANAVTIEQARSGSGDDTLIGNDSANVLAAGDGTDILVGGGGGDTLIGGRGGDTLTGGAGADIFRFEANGDSGALTGRDLITDFESGSDLIDLSALNASRFIGSALFSGRAGEVRFAASDGSTIIELDSNGDRLADFSVELDQFAALTIGNFLGVETDASGRGGGGGGKKTVLATQPSPGQFDTAAHDDFGPDALMQSGSHAYVDAYLL